MNLSSIEFGAQVIDCSSEVFTCEARNILSDDLSSIWLSDGAPPQWICISLAGPSTRQHRSNLFGGVDDDTGMTLCLFLCSKVKIFYLLRIRNYTNILTQISIAQVVRERMKITPPPLYHRRCLRSAPSAGSAGTATPQTHGQSRFMFHRTVTQRKAHSYTNNHAIHDYLLLLSFKIVSTLTLSVSFQERNFASGIPSRPPASGKGSKYSAAHR